MAVDKITFADKVSMIESTLPVINRIRDIDVNEIKDVVNNNADELTTMQSEMNNLDNFRMDAGSYSTAQNVTSSGLTLNEQALTLEKGKYIVILRSMAITLSGSGSQFNVKLYEDGVEITSLCNIAFFGSTSELSGSVDGVGFATISGGTHTYTLKAITGGNKTATISPYQTIVAYGVRISE